MPDGHQFGLRFPPAISLAGEFLRPRLSDPRQGADCYKYRQFEHDQWNRGDRHDTSVRALVRAAYWRLAADPDWPAKRGAGISGHHRSQAFRQLGLWLANFAGRGFTVGRPELSARDTRGAFQDRCERRANVLCRNIQWRSRWTRSRKSAAAGCFGDEFSHR